MSTYRELIGQSKEAREAGELDNRVGEASAEMMAAIATANRTVSRARQVLGIAAAAYPFNPAAYVEAARDLQDAEDDLADYKKAASDLGLGASA